jgi:hypothetical protein
MAGSGTTLGIEEGKEGSVARSRFRKRHPVERVFLLTKRLLEKYPRVQAIGVR